MTDSVSTPITVVNVADDRAIAIETKIANAQSNSSVSHATVASAQSRIADSISIAANLESLPYPDFAVWMAVFTARAQHPNVVAASLPEVITFSDRALAEFKRRFPRSDQAAAANIASTSVSSSAGFLPELNVSLFQQVTEVGKP